MDERSGAAHQQLLFPSSSPCPSSFLVKQVVGMTTSIEQSGNAGTTVMVATSRAPRLQFAITERVGAVVCFSSHLVITSLRSRSV